VAANRNNAVRHATGDYLFFTDGDAVAFPDVLEQHLAVAARGCWVAGYGVRLTEQETERLTEDVIRSGRLEELWPGWDDPRGARLVKGAARFRRRALIARFWPSERRLRKLQLIGLQSSVPREAFERVNGFDEDFRGWGEEDLDLGLRLGLAGVRGRTVADVSRTLHLYHKALPATSQNLDYFRRPRRGKCRCDNGLHRDGP